MIMSVSMANANHLPYDYKAKLPLWNLKLKTNLFILEAIDPSI